MAAAVEPVDGHADEHDWRGGHDDCDDALPTDCGAVISRGQQRHPDDEHLADEDGEGHAEEELAVTPVVPPLPVAGGEHAHVEQVPEL